MKPCFVTSKSFTSTAVGLVTAEGGPGGQAGATNGRAEVTARVTAQEVTNPSEDAQRERQDGP